MQQGEQFRDGQVATPLGGGDINGCLVGKILFEHKYEEIISLENLFEAWGEFRVGKKIKAAVQRFELNLMSNLITLHESLTDGTYRHSEYRTRIINDPKRRVINVAGVRDRVLHRAIYRKLYPFFDKLFIADSFSCRNEKGTHKALDRFKLMAGQVSMNNRRTCWVLKCDVRQFFASIDQRVLLQILSKRIVDKKIMWLLARIISSFSSSRPGVGLPLGNLTSQLLANVYLNELDQFVKQKMKIKHYIRYADDFVLLSRDKYELRRLLYVISDWLSAELKLWLHPAKVSISTMASGVDFLGWVHWPEHRILRGVTKKRMLRKVEIGVGENSLASYRGMLSWGNTYELSKNLDDQ